MISQGLIESRELKPGIKECRLNLAQLFDDEEQRRRFDERWPAFYEADPQNGDIFRKKPNELTYLTEEFIPSRVDERPPLLLILGNPASHSVASGFCFAFEGKGREHRFWRSLNKVGLLRFSSDSEFPEYAWQEQIEVRKRELFDLSYESPFRIGISLYFTIPSPASGSKWAGISGLENLFGRKGLRRIEVEGRNRIGNLIRKFLNPGCGVIAFQKDAYEGIRSSQGPEYNRTMALEGALSTKVSLDGFDFWLFGVPPTRLAYSKQFQDVLSGIMEKLLNIRS